MTLELEDEKLLPKDFIVFYCWQDHLDKKLYRYLIRDALNDAIATVQSELPEHIECVLRPDSDTSGKAGSIAIADTILEKIRQSTMVIADVNPVLVDVENERFYPNPNVMVEVGVAAQALGWRRIVCLFNNSKWSAEQLPFDIRHRRATGYKCDSPESRRKAVGELGSILSSAIRSTMQEICRGEIDPSQGVAIVRRAKDLRLLRDILAAIHLPTLDNFVERGLVGRLHYNATTTRSFFGMASKPCWNHRNTASTTRNSRNALMNCIGRGERPLTMAGSCFIRLLVGTP